MKLLDISSKGKEINEQVYEWNFHIITDETMSHNLIVELGAACDEAIQEVFRKYKYKIDFDKLIQEEEEKNNEFIH